MIGTDTVSRVIGSDVYDESGTKIGSASEVYLDDETGRPEWVTVRTGLFGTKESFVPIRDADLTDDGVRVLISKERVKEAPKIDADGHLSPQEEMELYRYYGMDTGMDGGTDAGMHGDTMRDDDLRGDVMRTDTLRDSDLADSRTADANVGSAMDGPAISEEEHEVTLHAERPVVDKEAVPVERVRLGTETVTEEARVSEELRKEQIDVDGAEGRERRM